MQKSFLTRHIKWFLFSAASEKLVLDLMENACAAKGKNRLRSVTALFSKRCHTQRMLNKLRVLAKKCYLKQLGE